jgi:hypothetical protein
MRRRLLAGLCEVQIVSKYLGDVQNQDAQHPFEALLLRVTVQAPTCEYWSDVEQRRWFAVSGEVAILDKLVCESELRVGCSSGRKGFTHRKIR